MTIISTTVGRNPVRECLTGGFLCAVSHKSSVPYQFLATGTSGTARCSQDWGHRMRHMHESPSVNILLTTKLLSLDPLSWDMDCFLTLWPLLIHCFVDNRCCTFGFLIFTIVKRHSLYNSLYILTERSLKHPCSTRGLGPHVFLSFSLSPSLSLSLPPSGWFSGAWKPTELTLRLGLSRPPREGARCLHERRKPCSRVLLVLCINQGILASFSHFLIVNSGPPGPSKGPLVHQRTATSGARNRDLVYMASWLEWFGTNWGRDLLRSLSTKTWVKWLESPIISLL